MLLPTTFLSPLFRPAPRRASRNEKRKKHMKNVALSVLIVLILGAVLVVPLSNFKITQKAVEPIIAGFPTAVIAVHQLLQKSGSRLSLSARKRGVVSLHGYSMPVVMLALYAILIVLSASELAGFLTGDAASAAGV